MTFKVLRHLKYTFDYINAFLTRILSKTEVLQLMMTTNHQIISEIYIFCYFSYMCNLDIDYHFLLNQVRFNCGTMNRIPPNLRHNQIGGGS